MSPEDAKAKADAGEVPGSQSVPRKGESAGCPGPWGRCCAGGPTCPSTISLQGSPPPIYRLAAPTFQSPGKAPLTCCQPDLSPLSPGSPPSRTCAGAGELWDFSFAAPAWLRDVHSLWHSACSGLGFSALSSPRIIPLVASGSFKAIGLRAPGWLSC